MPFSRLISASSSLDIADFPVYLSLRRFTLFTRVSLHASSSCVISYVSAHYCYYDSAPASYFQMFSAKVWIYCFSFSQFSCRHIRFPISSRRLTNYHQRQAISAPPFHVFSLAHSALLLSADHFLHSRPHAMPPAIDITAISSLLISSFRHWFSFPLTGMSLVTSSLHTPWNTSSA